MDFTVGIVSRNLATTSNSRNRFMNFMFFKALGVECRKTGLSDM